MGFENLNKHRSKQSSAKEKLYNPEGQMAETKLRSSFDKNENQALQRLPVTPARPTAIKRVGLTCVLADINQESQTLMEGDRTDEFEYAQQANQRTRSTSLSIRNPSLYPV